MNTQEQEWINAANRAFYEIIIEPNGIKERAADDYLKRINLMVDGDMRNEDIKNIIEELKLDDDTFEKYENKVFENLKEVTQKDNEKKLLYLPQQGRKLIKDFIKQSGKHLKNCDSLFYRQGDNSIVEYCFGQLRKVIPSRMVSLLEEYSTPGIEIWNNTDKEWIFKKKSSSEQVCKILLESKEFKSGMPLIKHSLLCPIPFLKDGELYFPKRGYNEDLFIYVDPSAPEIKTDIPLDEAKQTLIELHKEFCFKNESDLFGAIMSLLTPFCRGLYTHPNTRTPIYIYFANRERAGKDYLAGIRIIVFQGYAIEEPPISTGNNSDHNDELRKKIMGTIMASKSMLHFANNKGHINNCVLEQASTARQWSDRLLGGNCIATFDNTLEISLSGNIGTTLTPDLSNRSQIINLHLAIENANARKFLRPGLHDYITENRGYILSCLYSLVKNWHKKGMKPGAELFSSFPEWAAVVGGVMESVGFLNPLKVENDSVINLDKEFEDMKAAFEITFEEHSNEWMPKSDFRTIVEDNGLFPYHDYEKHNWNVIFGLIIDKYIGRELSDITMSVDKTQKRKNRQKIKFSKEKQAELDISKWLKVGSVGSVGSLSPIQKVKGVNNIIEVANTTKTTKTTKKGVK